MPHCGGPDKTKGMFVGLLSVGFTTVSNILDFNDMSTNDSVNDPVVARS